MSYEREINCVDFLPNFLRFLFDLDANQSHDNIKFHIVDFLRSNNFKAFAEYGVKDIVRVNNKGKSYKGRLDFYANRGDIEIVGEIDYSVPRKKSIEKCSQYHDAIKIFVLRGNKIKYFETLTRIKDIKYYLVIDIRRHKIVFSDISFKVEFISVTQ